MRRKKAPHKVKTVSHAKPRVCFTLITSFSGFSLQKKPYSFTYGVKDQLSGADFFHAESNSGPVTKGSYKVALPDGRIQIVNYVADENGYKAEVTYEGVPKYPSPSEYRLPPHESSGPYKEPFTVKLPADKFKHAPQKFVSPGFTASPSPYKASPTPAPYASPTPAPYASPKPAPYASPSPAPYPSPTPAPYASPTPAPYASPTPAPYSPSLYSPSPSPVHYASPSPTTPAYPSPRPAYHSPTPTPRHYPTPSPKYSPAPPPAYGSPAPRKYHRIPKSVAYESQASFSNAISTEPPYHTTSTPYHSPSTTSSPYANPSTTPYTTRRPKFGSKRKNRYNSRRKNKNNKSKPSGYLPRYPHFEPSPIDERPYGTKALPPPETPKAPRAPPRPQYVATTTLRPRPAVTPDHYGEITHFSPTPPPYTTTTATPTRKSTTTIRSLQPTRSYLGPYNPNAYKKGKKAEPSKAPFKKSVYVGPYAAESSYVKPTTFRPTLSKELRQAFSKLRKREAGKKPSWVGKDQEIKVE